MAGNIPHNLTDVKMHVGPHEYGPLNAFEGEHMSNFCGGNYFVTTAKNEFIPLYRLHGGQAGQEGQYWSVEQRGGNEAYRHDMAVLPRWGNTLQNESMLLVPKGVLLFEGKVGAQGHYLGGGWQIFIPRRIVQSLFELKETTLRQSGNSQRAAADNIIQRMNNMQSEMVLSWEKERARRIASRLQNSTTSARFFNRLPSSIQNALQKSGSTFSSSGSNLPTGTYILHEERVPSLDGSFRTLSVSVRTEFVKSVTTQQGRTTVTTNYYNIIYTTEYK